MNQRAFVQIASSSKWEWPVDIMRYDHSPWLSSEEQGALESWIMYRAREQGGRIPQELKQTLHRLLLPLSDVLDSTPIDESSRRGTLRLIALGMHQRKTAFWAWSSEEWIEMLSTKKRKANDIPGQEMYVGNVCRGYAIALAYLLCDFKDLPSLGVYYRESLANKLFGEERVQVAVQQVLEILKQWGYKELNTQKFVPNAVYETLLVNRHPNLATVTRETLEFIYYQTAPPHLRNGIILLSRVLVHLGIIAQPLMANMATDNRYGGKGASEGVHEEWVTWCQRWRDTSTFAPNSREGTYYNLLKAGHWLAENHPEITSPAQWTRALTIEYVAAVDRMVIGQWVPKRNFRPELAGKPLTPRSKSHLLGAISVFFRDCQEWLWIPRRFDPRKCFSTPRAVRSLIGPDPRVIADDIWAIICTRTP
jgi:hypothetical protein